MRAARRWQRRRWQAEKGGNVCCRLHSSRVSALRAAARIFAHAALCFALRPFTIEEELYPRMLFTPLYYLSADSQLNGSGISVPAGTFFALWFVRSAAGAHLLANLLTLPVSFRAAYCIYKHFASTVALTAGVWAGVCLARTRSTDLLAAKGVKGLYSADGHGRRGRRHAGRLKDRCGYGKSGAPLYRHRSA